MKNECIVRERGIQFHENGINIFNVHLKKSNVRDAGYLFLLIFNTYFHSLLESIKIHISNELKIANHFSCAIEIPSRKKKTFHMISQKCAI